MQHDTIQFLTMTEQEAERLRVGLEPGTYEVTIVNAEPRQSKSSGKRMLKIKLQHKRSDGSCCHLYDYLLLDQPTMLFKLHHCLKSAGLGKYITTGSVPLSALIGATCKAKVYVKKDKTGQYADSLAVDDYRVGGSPQSEVDNLNDVIPF